MNNRMKDILKLARIQLWLIPIFIFVKLIRPPVLKSNAPDFFKTVLLSIPNFFQSITGILVITGLGLFLIDLLNKRIKVEPNLIYLLSAILTGVLVTLQELKIIDIRPNSTMDHNDLIFSFMGLLFGYWVILKIKPRIPPTN